jgi:exopolyphosphatase/guanosine-5'-triphosphate,3'-diphosphate pyrophosphatase
MLEGHSIMPSQSPARILAAIDVGTNAARLKLAEVRPNGKLQSVQERRDAIRPGEGVFRTGKVAPQAEKRLVDTLREYAEICASARAMVRAVATSSLRDAVNGRQVRQRVKDETGVDLEIISGLEEARLICMAVLEGAGRQERSLVIDIGGGSTEVIRATGATPKQMYSLALGTVRLTERFDCGDRVEPKELEKLREYAQAVVVDGLGGNGAKSLNGVYGSSGTVRSLVAYAGSKKEPTIRLDKLSQAVEELAAMSAKERLEIFEPRRADVVVAGAVILEALAEQLGFEEVRSVDRGLRDGVLLDLLRRLDG